MALLLAACGPSPETAAPDRAGASTAQLGSQLFFDGFNRTSGLGAEWFVASGAFATNGAAALGTAASSYAVWRGQPDPDGTVSVTLSRPTVATHIGVLTRANPSAPERDHYAGYVAPDGTVAIARRDAWNYTYLATGPLLPSGAHVLSLTATGTAPVELSLRVDDQVVLRATDSSGSARASGLAGMFDYSGRSQPLDDFRVNAKDAPPVVDAGMGDAGTADAGAGAADAGAGAADAGAADAGAADAGVADAGTPDAGVRDAGAADAGAGALDGGTPDSGTSAPADGGATGGSTVIFFDPFNRFGSLGGAWSVPYGSFSLNGAVALGTAASSYAVWTGQAPADATVSVRISPPSAATYYGVIARAKPSSPARDHYAAFVMPDGNVGVARRDAWEYTYLATAGRFPAGAHELSLTATGSAPVLLSVRVDGVEVIRVLDSSRKARSSGRAGIFDYDGKSQPLDDFTVRTPGVLSPPDAGTPPLDAGTAAPDAGTTADAGAPAPDAGSPILDAGTPSPSDGGNPVALENARAGDSSWRVSRWSSVSELSGYFSTDSASAGETVVGHVHSRTYATVTWELSRLGHYDGAGGRRIAQGQFSGAPQPSCPKDAATGLVECTWGSSFSFQVRPEWVSGVYVVRLTRSDGAQAAMILTVRDSRRAAVMVQQSVTTWQAYNDYGGESLYTTQLSLPQGHAVKVSFARPYVAMTGEFYDYEADAVRWLESQGFDLTYVTNLDFSRDPDVAQRAKVFLSLGHDEYWTGDQRDGLERARGAGVSQGYFSANSGYWQIRVEPGAGGSYRRIVCYKDGSDPLGGTSQSTTLFRDPPINRPENGLIGVMSDSWHPVNVPISVEVPNHWLFAGTGLGVGDTIGQIVGYEADRIFDNGATPAGTVRVAGHPLVDVNGVPNRHDLSLYQHPSGAIVLGAGTIEWGWGLYAPGVADARLQRITANFLGAAGAFAATPRALAVNQSAWTRADASFASSAVSTIAGVPGTYGSTDGAAHSATFQRPSGIAVATDGTIYVSDAASHRIRKVQGGVVSTLAGGVQGYSDGTGSTARFNRPQGIALLQDGTLLVADSGNHCIRRVTTSGAVSTFAGQCRWEGRSDGSAGSARFRHPQAIAVGPSGAAYVADTRNNAIRKIASGQVSTFATSPNGDRSVFHMPNGLAVASDESVYVVDSAHRAIKRVSASGQVSTLISGWPASSHRMPIDGGGFADGTLSEALALPGHGIAVSGTQLFFSDSGNNRIRRIDLSTSRVTTFAGSGRARCEDGAGATAGTQYPQGLAFAGGALYAADSCGALRRLSVP